MSKTLQNFCLTHGVDHEILCGTCTIESKGFLPHFNGQTMHLSGKEPLKSDPMRDASSSIRGYVYQIYQSIYSWMQLGKDEYLFLERAEDFDVHSPGQVETVQVKDTSGSGNITLRSQDVIDALNNYYTNCISNPTVIDPPA